MAHELNVLALVKGEERYVFLYEDESQPALIELFREWAADPALSFNWFDVAVLTEKSRQQLQDAEPTFHDRGRRLPETGAA